MPAVKTFRRRTVLLFLDDCDQEQYKIIRIWAIVNMNQEGHKVTHLDPCFLESISSRGCLVCSPDHLEPSSSFLICL